MEGDIHTFGLNLPIIYRLPKFSPWWKDYSHQDGTNKTTVMTDDKGTSGIDVYTAAQLQALWQAVFVEGLDKNTYSQRFDVQGYKIQIDTQTYNTLISTYPNFDTIHHDVIPDLANLSDFWTVQSDGSIKIKQLCDVFPEGSIDSETGDFLRGEQVPISGELIKRLAKCYGLKDTEVEQCTSMAKVKEFLVKYGKIPKDYVFNNVHFPPVTIVSPEWWQMPLSAFDEGRSPVSSLADLTDKISISDLHLNITNAGNSSYGTTITMGVFKSPTISVTRSMEDISNSGPYNVQKLAAAGDHFEIYSSSGKVILCNSNEQEYDLTASIGSWGYNLVVKADIEYKNFFNQGVTSTYSNLILPVWTGNISYKASCKCYISVLQYLHQLKLTNKALLGKYIEELNGGGGVTPVPPEPTTTTNGPSGQVAAVDGVGRGLTKSVAIKKSMKSVQKVQGLKSLRKDGPNSNDLYANIDTAIAEVLDDPKNYPLNQGLSIEGLKANEQGAIVGPYKLSQYCDCNTYEDPDQGTKPALQPTGGEEEDQAEIKDISFSSPVCAPGINCYGRRGVCLRANNFNGTAIVSNYEVKHSVDAGSELGAVISTDEIFMINPIQMNKDNLDALQATMEEKGQTEIVGAQHNMTDEDTIQEYVEDQGQKIPAPVQGNGFWQDLIGVGAKVMTALAHDPENGMVGGVANGRGALTLRRLTQPTFNIQLQSKEGRNLTPALFTGTDVDLGENFKPYKNPPIENDISQWSEADRALIESSHQGLKNIPYMLKVDPADDKTLYTPGLVTITKSQITNINASLATTKATGDQSLPEGFRTEQNPADHFNCQTTNRCLVILSSIAYGQAGFEKVACVCNTCTDFIIAPAPITVSQPSAANTANAASIYGTFRDEENTYVIFNNAMLTGINDLSGSIQFLIPNKIPVLEGEQVVLKDMKEYVEAGGRIYSCIYNLMDIDVHVKLGSGISMIEGGETAQQIALTLWNYNLPEPRQATPTIKYGMPQIPAGSGGWKEGRIFALTNTQESKLPVLCKYFYAVTDKQLVIQASTPADATVETDKAMLRLKKLKKGNNGRLNAYQMQKGLESKLPMNLSIKVKGC